MRITHPRIVFDPREPTGGTDDPTPEPSSEPDPAPEPSPEPSPTPSGPWSDDLASTFEDEAIRSQVDEFLRGKVQPYITKLEQESAGNRNANKLWTDFSEKPVETFITVADELFGDEVTEAIGRVLRGEGTQADEDLLADLEETNDPALPPEQQEILEWAQDKRREEAYNAEMERVKGAHPDIEIEAELFHPFVVAADGNFDAAVESYKQFLDQAKEKYGVSVPSPDDVTPPAPPNTLGSDTRTATPPPTEEKYETIDDAIDAFFAEQKSAPPVVGAA